MKLDDDFMSGVVTVVGLAGTLAVIFGAGAICAHYAPLISQSATEVHRPVDGSSCTKTPRVGTSR